MGVFAERINHHWVSERFGESVLAEWICASPAAVRAGCVIVGSARPGLHQGSGQVGVIPRQKDVDAMAGSQGKLPGFTDSKTHWD